MMLYVERVHFVYESLYTVFGCSYKHGVNLYHMWDLRFVRYQKRLS